MAGAMTFHLSPAVLEWARNSMGYSIEEAAKKAGVPAQRYEAWETGKKVPTYKQLEALAEKVYKRPVAILLLSSPPIEESIQQEFRSLSNARIRDLPSEVRLALRKARRYQLILEEVSLSEEPALYSKFKLSIKDDPIEAAAAFRKQIDLTLSDQRSWKPIDAYRNFQRKIESIGIYIFKLKMPMPQVRAFCLVGKFPVIVINTDDSENGRIFSLFHEVCHILLNENDVFNDEEMIGSKTDYSKVEQFCNVFSASILVPDDAFQEDIRHFAILRPIVEQNIKQLAKRYNVSSEVIARKMLLHKLIEEDYFWRLKRIWDAAAKAAKEKRNEVMKDSEGGIDPGIKVLFEKGRPYVSSVINAYQQGVISSADLADYLESKLNNLAKITDRLQS